MAYDVAELPPEGPYTGSVEFVNTVDSKDHGELISFSFLLEEATDDEGFPAGAFCACPKDLNSGSELRELVQAILGRDLTDAEADGDFDLDTLINHVVQLKVKHIEVPPISTYAIADSMVHLDGPRRVLIPRIEEATRR